MIRSKLILLMSILAFVITSCGGDKVEKSEIIAQSNLKHNNNRVAAEWEPAIGTLVVWPLDLPHKLVVELSKDAKLFTLVPTKEDIAEAKTYFTEWGIDLNNVEFIISKQGMDSWWARDWGAFAVFDSVGNMSLADGQYKYSTPVSTIGCSDSLEFLFSEKDPITGEQKIILTTDDDSTPLDIANHMGYNRVDLPFTYTGGNVFMDGRGNALSTCIIKNENNFIGVSTDKFIEETKSYMGIENYNFISNFEISGIQHIDCYLKLLDNNRLIVMEPPVGHELYEIYKNVEKNELPLLRNAKGEPYEIIKLNTATYLDERLAAYSNAIIINKVVYVPLFGIDQDSIALQQWAEAMSGYTIKGFEYKVFDEPKLHPRVLQRRKSGFGWKDGDALHCRTRAMWDPQMLYIAFEQRAVKTGESYLFEANVIDYSNSGLVRNKLQLCWREKGASEWIMVQMEESDKVNYYKANVENLKANTQIEYYMTATTAAGKTEAAPMTAPKGFYSITTK